MKSPMMSLGVAMLALLLLAIVVISICMSKADGAELGTRSDLQIAVYDRMMYDSTNTRFPPAMVRRWINQSLAFVESRCKCNVVMDTIRMNPDSIFYDLPSGCEQEGVLLVAKLVNHDLIAMSKRPVTDFGKENFAAGTFYSVVGDTLLVHKKPDANHLMYIWYWQMQGDLAADTTSISLATAYRASVVDYAEGLYRLALGDRQTFETIKAAVLQDIFMMAAEPEKETQGFGVDTTQ